MAHCLWTHPHPIPQASHSPYILHTLSHPPLSPSHKVCFSVYLPLENHITIYLGANQSTKYFLTFLLFIRSIHFFLFPPMVSGQTTVISSQLQRQTWPPGQEVGFAHLQHVFLGFPGGSDGKESAYNAGDLGWIPGLGRSPGERNGYPLLYSCLENSMYKRSLEGYSPWGCKEAYVTEQLSMHTHTNNALSCNAGYPSHGTTQPWKSSDHNPILSAHCLRVEMWTS